jgi:lipoyl(octanoyl) transferase
MITALAQSSCIQGVLLTYDRLDYEAAWALQRSLVEQRLAGQQPDSLLLMEHAPVFTIGRSGKQEHYDETRLTKAGYAVYRIERGGSVTYHGPGQLVGYPILRLASFCAGPKAYVALLEQVLIQTLSEWGIEARRIEAWPGVWVGQDEPAKIAAIGVKIQRGVTMHGFALNVTMDLSPFRLVTPCGIQGCRVTSMADVLGRPVDLQPVRDRLAERFADCFSLRWTE